LHGAAFIEITYMITHALFMHAANTKTNIWCGEQVEADLVPDELRLLSAALQKLDTIDGVCGSATGENVHTELELSGEIAMV
jgi:hypothetical protein